MFTFSAMIEIDTSKWRDDDKVFIEIHSFPAMLEQVRNHSFVTFVGVPGSGKTATARHIALILQREGYQILPIESLKYLKKYCDPKNPQVFVIDDVLGIFGIDKDAYKRLCMYKNRLKKPVMPDTKIIMTCREVVFRNEALSGCFLSRKKNVILLNSGENELNDQDEQNLLAAYQLDETLLVSEHLKSSLYRKMFPLLFKLFSQKKFRVYGLEFFRSPIPCILKMLGKIKSENKIQYASLVLLMANQNKLSSNILKHESSRHFNDKKCKIVSACRVNCNTESFKFIDALSEMIGTYTKKCDGEFSFLHASMFEIIAYHFGQQFPELLLQHMPGNYIANYIKVDPHDTEQRKREGEDKRQRDEEEKIDLCIPLQGSLHQKLAERLFRDVINREFYNVFGNEALKHYTVLQAFIGVLKEMSYAKLFSVFLLELKEKFKKNSCDQAKFGVKGEDFFDIQKLLLGEKTTKRHYEDSVRAISWVIYHGHHQILQCIIDRMLEEEKNVDDLFINFEDNRRKTNNAQVCAGQRAQKGPDYYTIGPSFLKDYGTIIRKCNKPVTEEQFRLLCLSCYSGNLNTVRIILSHVKEDVVKHSTHQEISGEKQNVIWNFKPLVIACKLGNVEIAKELIEFNANVNLNDATHTPLTAACENGHLDVAKVLIKEGADVNLCYKNQTPLTAACENGDAALVNFLIIEGVDVNLCNGNQTPLTVTCHMGHKSIIEMLIKAETVFVQSDDFLAARCLKDLSTKEEITKEGENLDVEYENINSDSFQEFKYQMRLKNAKVDINKRDKNKTPLTAACFKGFSEIVQLLVEARADIDLQDASHTPLTAACENGHLSVVAILIKKGADVNLCDGNQTPLTAACYRGNFRIVQMLIEIKVQADKGNAYDAIQSMTCLRQEVQEFSKTEANLNLEAETKLVNATVDINKRDKKKTPLTAACYNGHENIVQLLLESGADVNLHDVSYVPLTAACKYGHLSVVKLLINANADVNKNYRWNTPLRTACSEGHLGIVEELIRANANINQTDVTKTPLGIACIKGHLNIVKELIREGAIINLEGPESTVMLARKNGHLSVVEELNRAVNLRD